MKHLLQSALLAPIALLILGASPPALAGGPYPVVPPVRPVYPYAPYRVVDPFWYGWGLTWSVPLVRAYPAYPAYAAPPEPPAVCTPTDCPPPPPLRHRRPGAYAVPPAPPAAPDPVIEPRNGQGWQQTEADRQACNRLAAQDQAALLDAQVFQHSVFACMDGRGYTLR